MIPGWQQALSLELQALEENGTWSLTTLPTRKHLVGCKWVYRIKYNSDGSIERYKAHLFAKGIHNKKILIILKLFPLLQN